MDFINTTTVVVFTVTFVGYTIVLLVDNKGTDFTPHSLGISLGVLGLLEPTQ